MTESLIALRHSLHQHPEVSGEEFHTAERIKSFLGNLQNAEYFSGIGGNGLAVVFEFAAEGPVVLFRCELDALPIQEANDFSYKSVIEGTSHKCGHDGHIAILCGFAQWLNEKPFSAGKIIVLFQPAEETGEGALAVMNDPQFLNFLQPDYAFALHNLPGYAMHEIIVIENVFTPDVRSLGIYFKGLQAHASEPEKGINPAKCIAELILELDHFNVPDVSDENFALLTPVYSTIGEKAYGIAAGTGELHYTIRTATNKTMELLIASIKTTVELLSKKHQLEFSIQWFDHFPLTINNNICIEKVKKAAEKNNFKIYNQPEFIRFGEDFGWFSQKYPSAMFGIGAGKDTPPLHNPAYDFPDELIVTGVKMMKGIAEELLG